jgi:hypothetical protein
LRYLKPLSSCSRKAQPQARCSNFCATTDQSNCRRNPKHISSMVTNASFHSCINVRVYKGRLPQATTLRYLKPLSRICRQGLPPVRRNPFLGSSRCPASASRIQLSRIVLRQPQISRCRRNPKHINEYGYECIISFMYKR